MLELHQTIQDHLSDGGVASRKLWVVIFTMLLVTGFSTACSRWPVLQTLVPTLNASLIGLCAMYLGVNVTAKHVLGKMIPSATPQVTEALENALQADGAGSGAGTSPA